MHSIVSFPSLYLLRRYLDLRPLVRRQLYEALMPSGHFHLHKDNIKLAAGVKIVVVHETTIIDNDETGHAIRGLLRSTGSY
jgi:hypothetical protein